MELNALITGLLLLQVGSSELLKPHQIYGQNNLQSSNTKQGYQKATSSSLHPNTPATVASHGVADTSRNVAVNSHGQSDIDRSQSSHLTDTSLKDNKHYDEIGQTSRNAHKATVKTDSTNPNSKSNLQENNELSKRQRIPSLLFPRRTTLHGAARHKNLVRAIHKYISPNGMEHRYMGAPIHRYLSKPVNIEAFTGNGIPNDMDEGKPFIGDNGEKPLDPEFMDGHHEFSPKKIKFNDNGVNEEEPHLNEKLIRPMNDFVDPHQSNANPPDAPPPIELNKQFDEMGGYNENRFGLPIGHPFHGHPVITGNIPPNLMIQNGPMVPGLPVPGIPVPGLTGPGLTGPGLTGPGLPGAGLSVPGLAGPGLPGPGLTGPGFPGPGLTGPGLTGPGFPGAGLPVQGLPVPGLQLQGLRPPHRRPHRLIVVHHRPRKFPPQRLPMHAMVHRPPGSPHLVIVDHHHLVNGPCEESPCRNAGTCSAIGSEFRCICPWGYKGDRCEVQSHCIPNPCQNFGKCTELESDFECTCHPGFHGKDCSMESKCDPNPCRNGGYCTETREAYICSCKPGFMGKSCEQESKCHPVNPCRNNGFCKEDSMGYHCSCPNRFSGINCEVPNIGPCDNHPCLNGGTCIVDQIDATKFTCSCLPQFGGTSCHEPRGCTDCAISQCVHGVCLTDTNRPHEVFFRHGPCDGLNPCLGGGRCIPMRYSHHCVCPMDRTGAYCEVPIFPCNHCSKHAHCIEDKCVCMTGYVGNGFHCKRARPHCHPNPCENGGTCREDTLMLKRNYESNWFCECAKGYSGERCTVFDPCSGYVCHNGGSCFTTNGQPRCKCMSPFEGPTCEQDNLCLPSNGKSRSVCMNGGTCEFVNGAAQCKCPPMYEGENCNKNKCDKCDPNAKCVQGHCICKPGYVGNGFNCELERSKTPGSEFCSGNPCRNGATCIEGKYTFYCVCPSDYYGRTCEKPREVKVIYKDRPYYAESKPTKSLCHPSPCLNGGICKETTSNDFECICTNPRYKGRFCDVDMCSECDIHARCVRGKCVCKEGYEGDGYTCTKAGCGGCPHYARCENNVCVCRPGYAWPFTAKKSCIVQASYTGMKKEIREKPKIQKPPSKPKQWSEDIIVTEYTSLGCWADSPNWRDSSSRALMSLEGLDSRLSDDYHARKSPISKCADIARSLGYKLFAIQNGGQCFSGPETRNYKKYGPSEKCRNGVGGPLANDVYKL